ncbi:MAG TPA: AMP-binding protein [Gammaproteobacteria bacterium]
MGRPWLASYPPSVPAEIDPSRYASVADLLRASFARYGEAPALSNLGTTLRFADVDRESRAFASYLADGLKLAKGDRVAVMLPNLLQSPIVIFGILRTGLVVVNVNPLYTPHELEHQLKDCGARALVVLENFAHTVAAVLGRTPVETVLVTRVGDALPALKRGIVNFVTTHVKRLVPPWDIPGAVDYRTALALGRRTAFAEPRIEPSDLAFLQYTGGTTGVAKGAMLTHRNIVANMLQASAIIRPYFNARDGDAVTALPLYHIFALTVNLLCFIELGAHNVLITNPRDVRGFVAELRKLRPAFITGVNTLFNSLLHHPGFARVDFRWLKISLAGGMAVQADVAARWHKLTGKHISQGYGLTEASPIVSANLPDGRAFNGSVGLPLPSTDIAILDEGDRELGVGATGEICVRGPQVMAGYWNRPDETAAVFVRQWLRTGDIGRVDAAGLLFIEDRKKDMIVVSGFKVYPNEVEDAVTLHPDVVEAAAIGIPSEQSGEIVKVFVVSKSGKLTADEVIAHCRKELTAYKVPHVVEFVKELPKSNVGKVLRRELKERVQLAG